jgi:hypothetical protein
MEHATDEKIRAAIDAWLRWLPHWTPSVYRAQTRLCRQCFGSPVVKAAGLDRDIPHTVQHALAMRIKHIIDDAVTVYTHENLPLLSKELTERERRRAARLYRPREGLPPEYDGLDLDPQPEPHAPFLFTLNELEQTAAAETDTQLPRILTENHKTILRKELRLADEYANLIGTRICIVLAKHRSHIRDAATHYVEPHIQAMLADLALELEPPPGRPGRTR